MSRPLLVTADTDLLDALLRLVAAADAEAEVAPDPGGARRSWAAAPVVLVGADALDAAVAVRPTRRPAVVVVSRDVDDATVWRRAMTIGAEHVAFLPDSEPWLVERIRDALRPARTPAPLVGVVGGRGGAGATTLAVALSFAGLRRGAATMLVDADPLGGGVDLVLGGEDVAGPRWPDLAGSPARVTATNLADALPRLHELAVLSWDRDGPLEIPPDVLGGLLDLARRSAELVVVDLPRSFDPAAVAALDRLDLLLLVVPAEVRACAAAARTAARAAPHVADVRVVVRGPAPSGLRAEVVAEAVGLPLAGSVRAEPHLAVALENGDPPGRDAGPLADLAAELVAGVLAGERPP